MVRESNVVGVRLRVRWRKAEKGTEVPCVAWKSDPYTLDKVYNNFKNRKMFHFNWLSKTGQLISIERNLIIVSLTNRFRGNKNPNKKLNFSTLLHVAFITLKSNPSCGMEARLQLRYTPSILHYLSLSLSDKPSLCRLTVFVNDFHEVSFSCLHTRHNFIF